MLSQDCILVNGSHCRNSGQNIHSQDRGGGEEPPNARSSSSELGKEPRQDASVRWLLVSARTNQELWEWIIPALVCFEARSQVWVQTCPLVFSFRVSPRRGRGQGRGHIFQVEISAVLRSAILWRREQLWEVSTNTKGSWGWVPWPVREAWVWHWQYPTPPTLVFPVLFRSTCFSCCLSHPGTVSPGFWLVPIPGQFTRGD